MKKITKHLLKKFGYKIQNIRHQSRMLLQETSKLNLSFEILLKSHIYSKGLDSPLSFVQIGCYDGIMCDPLYPFLQIHKNWTGIMLEPQKLPFSKLSNMYRGYDGIKILNKAISNKTGESVMYMLEGGDLPEWTKGMASFAKENILFHEKWFPQIGKYIVEHVVSTVCFSELLDSVRSLDFLVIDAEGYDSEIIRMFPFHRLKPKILRFESRHLSSQDLDSVLFLLQSVGYNFTKEGDEDVVCLLNDP